MAHDPADLKRRREARKSDGICADCAAPSAKVYCGMCLAGRKKRGAARFSAPDKCSCGEPATYLLLPAIRNGVYIAPVTAWCLSCLDAKKSVAKGRVVRRPT